MTALATPDAFNTESATSGNTSAFSATAGSGAANGSYSVSVSQLASAQQLLSTNFTGGSTATVGTGTLQVSLGGTEFQRHRLEQR